MPKHLKLPAASTAHLAAFCSYGGNGATHLRILRTVLLSVSNSAVCSGQHTADAFLIQSCMTGHGRQTTSCEKVPDKGKQGQLVVLDQYTIYWAQMKFAL